MMPFIVLLGIYLFAEFFSLRAILFLTSDLSPGLRSFFIGIYLIWTLSIFFLSIYGIINREDLSNSIWMNKEYTILTFFVINFIFKSILGFTHGFNEGITSLVNIGTQGDMTRSKFVSLAGLAIASIPFSTLLYGMTLGRFKYQVIRKKIQLKNLPNSFKGVKIVHISDLHLGSIPKGSDEIYEAVKIINTLEPDYIFFTGDMINERAEEAERHIEALSQLKAKHGKYSILGNHDYGNYYRPWATDLEKQQQNVARLQNIQQSMGFELLRNENRVLEIDQESIRLIGLENWGAGHFSKYGDLDKALYGVEKQEVKLLLSHDPSHWDAQVLNKTNIDLSLAGHTHGCQYGVEIPGFKWSPVQYRYPRWAGLYKENNQQLYVNRGLGCIGYAGRFGIYPEITLFELF